MRYVVYDAGTGKIKSINTCPEEEVAIQVWAGEPYIQIGKQDIADIWNMEVRDGQLVEQQPDPDAVHAYQEKALKDRRNALLLASDWTQMPDHPMDPAKKEQWAIYRQALRDLPSNTPDPSNPTWPVPPT